MLVLNFWGIGCAVCIWEIPYLNEVVKKFDGQDVVFIAFGSNSEETIRRFIKKTPFNYNQIPDASDIHLKFLARANPVHIVIDKKGEIIFKQYGGGTDISGTLSLVIDRALAAN